MTALAARNRPAATQLDLLTGAMTPHAVLIERRIGEMADAFLDAQTARSMANAVAYRAFEADVPHEPGQLVYRTTLIEPGLVGEEFFMTKGHHHVVDSAEYYLGLAGDGLIVMQPRDGAAAVEEMPVGRAVHVPPGWAHRTVNVGKSPFLFLAVFFGDAGHDYASIERTGFSVRVFTDPAGYRLVGTT